MNRQIESLYLADALAAFRNYKDLADKAVAQVSEQEFFRALDAGSNSIAVVCKHLAGNLRSRWTDFLTTDGEKPDRDRDSEFAQNEAETRERISSDWETGWKRLFETLETLEPGDLIKIVKIRGEEHTVLKAVNRALAHAAYHTGQIVFLAKHFRASDWQNLSIARGASGQFNEALRQSK